MIIHCLFSKPKKMSQMLRVPPRRIHMKYNRFYGIGCLLILCFSIKAQSVDQAALDRLSDQLLELQNSELMQNGTISFSLQSTTTNTPLLSFNQEQSLPSASTLKLVSTATILSLMGGDYTYTTFLEYDGRVSGDTLHGNLYLRGTGDPSLGSGRFKGYSDSNELLVRWAEAVRRAGIRHITGQVMADPTIFDESTVADTWIWGDLGNYYGAGVQGLNFNENIYRVFLRAGQNVGDPTEFLKLEPSFPYLEIINRVRTGESGSGDQVYIFASPLGREIVLTGTVPRGASSFPVKGALPNPAFASAYWLTEVLRNNNLVVSGLPGVQLSSLPLSQARTILDRYYSPSLRDLCQQTNWWSINLYADSFLKLAGTRIDGKSNFDSAAKAVGEYWRTKGADTRGFYVRDGSGLSPTGSLTTLNLSDILRYAAREKTFPDFYQSIAVVGQTGTVRNIGKGTRSAGNVRAKSGSIDGTRAYAGYVTARSGELLSFAIIAHKYTPDNSRLMGQELAKVLVLLGEL